MVCLPIQTNGCVEKRLPPHRPLSDTTPPHQKRTSRLTARIASAVLVGSLFVWSPAGQAATAPDSFASLAKTVTAAVVNISSEHKVAQMEQGMPELPFAFPEGSPFGELFRHFQDQRTDHPRSVTALGSGFIIDPSGYIVTNNHVIADANDITVILNDGREISAKLIGADKRTDLALLKIDTPEPLPAVAFGDSDRMQVGDWILAVGNPFGLGGTVTAGIISARGRDIQAGPYDDFLQIDASINRGNSGGPTFDMDGSVIGINTAIASPNGGSVGIGFAIPSNLAKPVVAQLRAHGKVERGWLGVQIQPMSPDLATALGLEAPTGALVSNVYPESPAAKAGLRQGDVILEFAGTSIPTMRDLPRLVAAYPVGNSAKLVIWRDQRRSTVNVKIDALPAPERVAALDAGDGNWTIGTSDTLAGATLAPVAPETRQRFGVPADVNGVLVIDVEPNGSAAKQGLRPGDVIIRVDGTDVSAPTEVDNLVEAARESDQHVVLLLISRDSDILFLGFRLDTA